MKAEDTSVGSMLAAMIYQIEEQNKNLERWAKTHFWTFKNLSILLEHIKISQKIKNIKKT